MLKHFFDIIKKSPVVILRPETRHRNVKNLR